MRLPSPDDPCLCDSRLPSKDCCLAPDGWFKKPAELRAGGGVVGHRNPGCYAMDLGDCAQGISREHYISSNVLSQLADPLVTVSRAHWLPEGEIRRVGINSLVASVLCRRHNSMLSKLDAEAGRLFRALAELSAWGSDPENKQARDLYIFSGYDIERWLLKSLFGLLASGNVFVDGQKQELQQLNPIWLRVLFGQFPFLPNCGLWTVWDKDESGSVPLNANIESISDKTQTPPLLIGARATFTIVTFAAYLRPIRNENPNLAMVYRPMQLTFSDEINKKIIWFSWNPGTLVSADVTHTFPRRRPNPPTSEVF